jgi:hypothetical protein
VQLRCSLLFVKIPVHVLCQIQTITSHSVYSRSISVLFFQLHWGLPSFLILSHLLTKFVMYFSSLWCVLQASPISSFLIWYYNNVYYTLQIMKLFHCTVLSILLLHRLSQIQIFSIISCFITLLLYILLSSRLLKFPFPKPCSII